MYYTITVDSDRGYMILTALSFRQSIELKIAGEEITANFPGACLCLFGDDVLKNCCAVINKAYPGYSRVVVRVA